jgi:Flp pilus assembly protein TadD
MFIARTHKLFSFPPLVNMLCHQTTNAMDSFQNNLQLAFAAHNEGRHTKAEALCRKLISLNPADAPLQFLFGMVLHKLGRDTEAVEHLHHATELKPNDATIFHGLGVTFHSLKNYPRAVENFAKAIALKPQFADLHYSLGNSYYQLDEIKKAAAAFQRAVELNPQDAASWNNLGKSFKDLNRLEESIAAFGQALAIKPDYALARYGRAISLLASGNLADGLREYESRPRRLPREFSQPRWRGEDIASKTLFLHAEQGFGDAIQAVRFVKQVRERGVRAILECRPEQKSLFTFSNCADLVIAYGEEIPPFDYFTSLISVAGILGITLETIPNQAPYLAAPRIENLPPGKIKIGLVWAGNPHHHDDDARSLLLAELAPILQSPGKTFYNLQVPMPERDRALLPAFSNLINLDGRLKDFLDAAAIIAQMDLVIAVDTAVAHLAGALGKPVWLLVQHSPDWRWFQQFAETTPWYPTMRLFRQTQRGQWKPVIARVAEELNHFSASEKI